MFESVSKALLVSFTNIRFSDVIDVLIVSVFAYVIINLLIRVASRTLIATISLIAAVYILSRVFSLYMTEMLIQIITLFILIAAIVIFQNDIRRIVELFGTWIVAGRNKRKHYSNRIIDVLTETVAKLAERKTGALIALRGKEDLQRSVNGGVSLQGNVSQVLLYSIFNPKSPGHDGAVIIEGDKIQRFGAHLSLSTNLAELGGKGTRHAAALGLSEETDAFVIVVSEERGTISVAQNGSLNELKSSSELKEKLNSFWENNYERNKSQNKFKLGLNPYALVFSILLSITGWFLFTNQTDVIYRSFEVPIEFRNLNDNFLLKNSAPVQAHAILSGSEQAFRILDPKDLKLSINLEKIKKGSNEFTISEEDLDLPKGIALYSIDPNVVKIRAEQMETFSLPVKIQTVGSLPKGVTLKGISVSPEVVKVKVPETVVNRQKQILTEPINLNQIKNDVQIVKKLILTRNHVMLPSQKPEAVISISVEKKK